MLDKMFSENSRFYRFMMKVMDLIILNLLWGISSLPIITIGASTTALFTVTQKAMKNEESYLAKSYWRAFRENFRQATGIWLILLTGWVVLLTDLYIMGRLNGSINGVFHGALTGVVTVLLIFLYLTTLYVFPMQASYGNKVSQTLFKSLVFSIQHFGYTFQMIGTILFPLGAVLIFGMLTGTGWSWCVFFYLIAGVAVTVYWMSIPWQRLRNKMEEEMGR